MKRRQGAAVSIEGRIRATEAQSSSLLDLPYTATQPFRQFGKTLLAAKGTSTWLLCGSTASECAVPAGNAALQLSGLRVQFLAATLRVGTTWTRLWLSASITPSTGPPGWLRAAR